MKPIYVNARFLTQKITGVQKFGIEISKELNKLCECVFVSPPEVIHTDIAAELNVKCIGRFSSHLWEQLELPFYLKSKGNPLLFNYNGLGPVFYSNKVITIHDVSFMINRNWFDWRYSFFYNLFTSVSANFSRKVITVSEFSKKEILNKIKLSPSKVEVIHNAVNCKEPETVKPPIDGEYLLTVSSLDERKNLLRLIEAFESLQLENVKLVIVGASNKIFNTKITEPVKESIIFYGHANEEELVNLYKHAKLFIFPSLYEGFGIPPLEAMSLGCPVISSNSASLPEICSSAAYYINPYSTDSIASAIKTLLNNEEEKKGLIRAGFENLKRFSWKDSAEKLCNTLKQFNS